MRTIVRYVEGKAEWSDNVPSRARVPWTQSGSVAGVFAIPARLAPLPVDRSESAKKGWQTKRKRVGQET